MHSHLIYNIDDGSRNEEESITLIKGLHDLGFSKLITTPHTYKDFYPNTPETINAGLKMLLHSCVENGIAHDLHAASEYYGDEHLFSLLEGGQELLCVHDQYLLFEVSMLAKTPLLQQIIFKLKTKGYKPILAHPERYLYYEDRKNEVFKSFDCDLQVNLLSLAGYYGNAQKKLGLYLIEQDLVDWLGTDIHHAPQLKFLQRLLEDRKTMKILKSKKFKNIELL